MLELFLALTINAYQKHGIIDCCCEWDWLKNPRVTPMTINLATGTE
jgi:hypothetical protein